MGNISGRTHEKTPSSNTFSMIDLWILICIIFVTLALFEYGLVITIAYNLRESTAQVHTLDGGRNWTKVIDKLSRFIFPIAFVIVNAIYGTVPLYSDESQGIDIENYSENFKKL